MVDFAAEGLLDGLQGDARAARVRLLQALTDDGVDLDDLRAAAADNTLFLLPAERRVGAEPRWTFAEIAQKSGVEPEFLADLRRTAGLPVEDGTARVLTDVDLDAAHTTRRYLDAGVQREDMLEVVRILGRALAQAADAMRRASLASVFDRDADEHELAMRYADSAEALQPLTAPMLDQLLQLHLRHAVRTELLEVAERESGELPGAREVAVCFADLVGFTRVGEEVDPRQLGAIADRLETLARQIATPPVRLVKTIGDAVMLVSPDVDALIDAALVLIDAAEAEGEDYPQLRAGIARGPALHRAGDWYGRPVNLASRITAIARPGSVLCDQVAHDAAHGDWRWSFAGERRVRNVRDPVKVHRVRRSRPAANEPPRASRSRGPSAPKPRPLSARARRARLIGQPAQPLAGVGGQRAHQLAGRALDGQRVGLAGPQVDRLAVAGLARGGAQRRGHVVDLGIRAGRVGMRALEAVDDPARGAAGERPRQAGRAGRPAPARAGAAPTVPASGVRSSALPSWAAARAGRQHRRDARRRS